MRARASADPWNQAAEAAWNQYVTAITRAVYAWAQAAQDAEAAPQAAIAPALAAWRAAEASASAQWQTVVAAAQEDYDHALAGLQDQANAAWDEYAQALEAAGCTPAGGPIQFVQFAGGQLPKPPQSWREWFAEWLWNWGSAVATQPTAAYLDGLSGIARIQVIIAMQKRVEKIKDTYGRDSKEAIYAERELEALKAGRLREFYENNPLPPPRPGRTYPPFVPAYQDPAITGKAR
jgi:hypothetical protein